MIAKASRYDNSWDFTGRSDAYLRETFELFAKDDAPIYAGGRRAIIEACHARAIEMSQLRATGNVRGVCTLGIETPDGLQECGQRAISSWDATHWGVLVESARCAAHA
jgi:hypothetical protein